ncbi:STAS/SEC14 domain-containing protein [Saprospira sp. CCB-QB6]|uniref:DUF7793 family protein n=1 Tax=Saprospira sp. CCB-QB6 TaxID=3023936 RepID=UPI00234ADF1E|nr:STAS/SEC14 domain-containing protein [Saprospira sp. CCB-QB6]WCL81073.1 STAS/SEC14 domain-containing protein [Saprospira sp. CCB-QB6]
MSQQKITTPLVDAIKLDNGIIHEVYHPTNVTLEALEEHIAACRQAFGTEGCYLSDIRQLKSVCQQSRKHLANHSVAKASAVLVSSGFSTMVGNIFLKFNKPNFPTKLFTSKEKAMAWIEEQQAALKNT